MLSNETAQEKLVEQSTGKASGQLEQYLGLYRRDWIGWLLSERMHLSLPVIGGLVSFLYFGVLLALHEIGGDPAPNNLIELFSLPEDFYYYPNLIGVAYDLIANPMVIVLLVFMRDYIPRQFVQLQRDGSLHVKPMHSHTYRYIEKTLRNPYLQIFVVTALPILISSFITVIDIDVYQPSNASSQYSLLLSWLGRYASLSILAQIVCTVLIVNSHAIGARLNPANPDQCSGLAPFGNLALVMYSAFFVWAMMEAVNLAAGGSALDKAITVVSGQYALIYLWILFPFIAFYIFAQLIYRPHRSLRGLQMEYLETSGQTWATYREKIKSELVTIANSSQIPLASELHKQYTGDIELLEAWAKLDRYVTDLHTWPIPSHTLRLLAIFVNPLVPILLPVVVELVVSIVS